MTEFVNMFDDGDHHDREAGDGIYGCVFPPFQLNQTLSWQVTAVDLYSHTTTLPCSPAVVSFLPSSDPQLFINEFMASNDSTIMDEYGDFDDWIEIYNGDNEPVWLGDKYLSDELSNPDKWPLPDYTMQPGSFLLIWADEEQEEGLFHASFKLDADGEELGIFDNETTGYFLLDSVTFGIQQADTSFGRQEDGELPFIYFPSPTPGQSNHTSGISGDPAQTQGLNFYPNPLTGSTLHFSVPFSGWIYDLAGNAVWSGFDALDINISHLPAGMFILRDVNGNRSKLVKFRRD
jgi:hypothetical protein